MRFSYYRLSLSPTGIFILSIIVIANCDFRYRCSTLPLSNCIGISNPESWVRKCEAWKRQESRNNKKNIHVHLWQLETSLCITLLQGVISASVPQYNFWHRNFHIPLLYNVHSGAYHFIRRHIFSEYIQELIWIKQHICMKDANHACSDNKSYSSFPIPLNGNKLKCNIVDKDIFNIYR